jgi:hypothetical protein
MTAISTKGTRIGLSNGAVVPVAVAITAIAAAVAAGGPASITAANTLKAGDVVQFNSSTGFAALNNRALVVSEATAAEFKVVGAETFGSLESMANGAKFTPYPAADLINLCLSSFDIAPGTSNEIDTSTYCGSGSILGKSTPGTITLNGYVDKADLGFAELLKAEEDGKPRVLNITLPGDLGWLVGVVTIGAISYTVPLEGAVGFSVQASQNSAIKYLMKP